MCVFILNLKFRRRGCWREETGRKRHHEREQRSQKRQQLAKAQSGEQRCHFTKCNRTLQRQDCWKAVLCPHDKAAVVQWTISCTCLLHLGGNIWRCWKTKDFFLIHSLALPSLNLAIHTFNDRFRFMSYENEIWFMKRVSWCCLSLSFPLSVTHTLRASEWASETVIRSRTSPNGR